MKSKPPAMEVKVTYAPESKSITGKAREVEVVVMTAAMAEFRRS